MPTHTGTLPAGRSRRIPYGRILWVALASVALIAIGNGLRLLLAPIDDERLAQSTALDTLNDAGHALREDIARIVEPAMQRTRLLAHDDAVVAALQSGKQDDLQAACNRGVTSATEIDAFALFDADGKIVSINSVYPSGQAIPSERIDRVLHRDFSQVPVVARCLTNDGDAEALEFQTHCDITPALFDSTGLSVACSVPVRDPHTGERLGVASARLRFERLTALSRQRLIGGQPIRIEFVSDGGAYFSEDINAGRAAAPVPTDVLTQFVQAPERADHDTSLTHYQSDFLLFFKLTRFTTLDGGGLQVMLVADDAWLTREAREARMLASSSYLGVGVVLLLLAMLVRGFSSLRQSVRGTRLLIDTALDAIVAVDSQGVVTSWNPQAERTFGYRREETIGRPLIDLIAPEAARAVRFVDWFGLGTQAESGRRLDISAVRKDGARITIDAAITPIPSDRGPSYSVFLRDVTEERQRELQIAHAQKLESIGQLAAGIAHEINTPTQYVGDNTRFLFESVTGLVELLDLYEGSLKAGDLNSLGTALEAVKDKREALDLGFLREEIPKAFEQSLDGIKRIAEIVLAMKEFSHPGSTEKEFADLNAAIESTVTVARNRWKYVANLDLDLDPGLPKVPVLLGEFNQVLLNLVVNAADAISEMVGDGGERKGTIRVTTRSDDTHAIIEVIDDGPGIPADVRDRIFDPFFTTKEVGKGTGQGLAISRSTVVKKHGGELFVDSAPGKGARFTIRLPLVAPECAEELAAAA